MANKFQLKRTTVSGRTANTTNSGNTAFIDKGELAVNLADRKVFSSDSSNAIFEIGSNLTNLSVTTSVKLNNDVSLNFETMNGNTVTFKQQSDDNFVFYTTNASGAQRAVYAIYANTNASNLEIIVPTNFQSNVYIGRLSANGSLGTDGQVLTSNGSTVYWQSLAAIGTNVNATYAWTNTHSFAANVSFNNNISINSGNSTASGGMLFFSGLGDTNWKMGRNTNGTTKWFYTNNTIDIISAASPLEGVVIGQMAGNSFFETGYAGTFLAGNVTIGNTSSKSTINSTTFSGTANNANFLGGNSASDLRTYSDTKAATAYSNAVTYTDTKIGTANTAMAANAAAAYTNAVSYTDTKIGTANTAMAANAAAAYSNAVTYTDTKIGTANTAMVANAAAAYSNAVTYTNTKIGTANTAMVANAAAAYTNAVSYTDTKIGTANTAMVANAAAAYTNATVFAANASNANNGTLAEARLPYRMDQDVRTTDNVEFVNITVTGNITVSGTQTVIGGNSLSITDNMIYMNQGVYGTITNISGNGSVVTFTANNNYGAGWDVFVSGVDPSSYNGTYLNILAANATHFQVSNTNTAAYVSGGNIRGKSEQNPDLGFAFGYNDGSYHHGGFFRDASDGIFKVFDNYAPEPDDSVYIDTSNTTFHLANFQANVVYVGNTTVYSTINTTSFSGTANNATNLGGSSLATVQGQITGNAATAYTNAVSYTDTKIGTANTAMAANAAAAYSNAVTYTDTKIGTANTAMAANAATAYTNAVSYTDTKIGTANTAMVANASAAYSNAVTYTDTKIGTANTAIAANAAAAYSNAVTYTNTKIGTANTAMAANAAAAYSNAVTYTDTKIGTANTAMAANAATAYTNAVSYTDTKIGTANTAITGNAATAYTNAITIAANATNLTSGTVAFARLPSLYLGTTAIQSTSAAQAVSGITTLAAGNTTITGFANVTGNLTATNPIFNNIKHGYSTTATAAGTTVLTSSSNYQQFFTGTTTQIVSLPAPQTMTLGQGFLIVNNSTGNLEIRAANAAVVATVLPGMSVLCVSIDLTAGNGAAGWSAEVYGFSAITGTGSVVLSASPTLTGTTTVASANIIGGLSLSNGTSNFITWSTAGVEGPSINTRSPGTKLLLYPALSVSQTDYAMGISAATMWSSVPQNNDSFKFKWYGADIEVASLGGTGNFAVAGSVNAASHTVGTSFIANSSGTTANVASWGSTFRASNSTNFSGIKWEDTGGTIRAGMYRYDNSDLTISLYSNTGTYQSAPVIISASTGTVTLSRLSTTNGVFSGAVSGITTLAAGNTTITGFANVTSTLQVGGISTFSGNVVLGSVGVSANASFGTAGHVLHSNGTATYWAADDQGVTSVATGNGLTGGTITATGTVSVLANTGIVANATGLFVNSAYIATLTSNAATYSNTILVSDTRAVVTTPETVTGPQVRFDFKNNTADGLSDGSSYFGEMTFRPYGSGTDWSGGPSHQLGFTANNNLYHRSGNNTTWGSWGRLYKEGTLFTPSANVILGSVGLSANGGFGTAGHVLHSNGTATYWAADDDTNTTYDLLAVANTAANAGLLRLKDSSNANDTVTFTGTGTSTVSSNATHVIINSADQYVGTVTSVATANGLSGGTITSTGTLGVTTGSTLTVNTTGIHVNSALQLASLSLTGDLTVSGNLTVSGTRTYVNTTTLDIGDNIITLNADLGAVAPSQNAGLEIMRGTSANVQFLWDETNDRWSTNGQPMAVSSLVAAGAASGITTLAAGNTTITGFVDTSSYVSVGNSTVNTYITGTQVQANQNDTLSVPSYSWSTDTTTGIYRPSASTIGFTIAGVHELSINATTFAANSLNFTGIGTLAAGNTTITGFANVTSTLQVGGVATFAANANFDSGVLFVDGTNNRVGVNTTTPGEALDVTGNIRASQSITVGSGGTYAAGTIYSNADWGMIFRAKQASPAQAEFLWTTSADTQLMRLFSNGNLGIANTAATHKLSVNGTGYFGDDLTVNGGQVYTGSTQARVKYAVWSDATYGIGMKNSYTYGGLNNDYAMSFQMSNDNGRGFWWGDSSHTDAQGAMALSTDGKLTVAHSARIGFGESDTTIPGSTYALEVNGSFAATTKSFLIDHPTKPDMKLRYGSLEGPENGVYVRGRLKDSNVIELPDYWTGLVDEDTITVNLTAIGKSQDLWVEDIVGNKVIVGGENINCFYTVFAERKDVDKLEVEF